MKVTITQPNGQTFTGCEHLKEWWPLFNKLGVMKGIIERQYDVSQGSYNGGVKASGGTHDGGGVWDMRQYDVETITLARNGGAAAYHRSPEEAGSIWWPDHTHAVLVGDPCNGPARYQVDAYKAGYDGLGYMGRSAKDSGPKTIKRDYIDGIAWMTAEIKRMDDDMAHIESISQSAANMIGKAIARELLDQTAKRPLIVHSALESVSDKALSKLARLTPPADGDRPDVG